MTTPSPSGSPQVLVVYHRTGGFIGADDNLTIDSSRKVVVTRRGGERSEYILDQQTFDQVIRQLDQADFPKLKDQYQPTNPCCDLYEYTVTYKGRMVKAMDTVVPDQLQPALKSLNDLVERK